MQRRTFPLVLLYGFGLALALSLVFNGFLLYEQSHQQRRYTYDLGGSGHPVDYMAWQQQLSDCKQASQQKDSLIHRLEQVPELLPGPGLSVRRSPSK